MIKNMYKRRHCETPKEAWQSQMKGHCEGEACGNLIEEDRLLRRFTPRNDNHDTYKKTES